MGMTAHEYWEEDCTLVVGYRKAYEIKRDEVDATAWLQGLYVYVAVATALNNGFSNHKSEYPKLPFNAQHANQKKHEETPEEIRARYFNRFKAMEEQWNRYKNNDGNDTENQERI